MNFKMKFPIAGALLFSACLTTARAETPEAVPAPSGAQLFTANGCYLCHGRAGQGSPMTGPALAGMRLSDAAAADYVRAPSGSMPPYSAQMLSAESLAAIISYVRSLPPGRPASEIKLLSGFHAPPSPPKRAASPPVDNRRGATSPMPGKALYEANCAMCHGLGPEGGAVRALIGDKQRTQSQIAATVMAPPAGMPSLYPGRLSAHDVQMIADYIVSRK